MERLTIIKLIKFQKKFSVILEYEQYFFNDLKEKYFYKSNSILIFSKYELYMG